MNEQEKLKKELEDILERRKKELTDYLRINHLFASEEDKERVVNQYLDDIGKIKRELDNIKQ